MKYLPHSLVSLAKRPSRKVIATSLSVVVLAGAIISWQVLAGRSAQHVTQTQGTTAPIMIDPRTEVIVDPTPPPTPDQTPRTPAPAPKPSVSQPAPAAAPKPTVITLSAGTSKEVGRLRFGVTNPTSASYIAVRTSPSAGDAILAITPLGAGGIVNLPGDAFAYNVEHAVKVCTNVNGSCGVSSNVIHVTYKNNNCPIDALTQHTCIMYEWTYR